MGEDLLKTGLELFAAGDVMGATRVWLKQRQLTPDDQELASYLSHVRQLVPDVVLAVEAELEASGAAAQPPPAPSPRIVAPTVRVVEPAPPRPAEIAPTAPGPVPLDLPSAPTSDPWGTAARVEVASSAAGLDLVSPPPSVAVKRRVESKNDLLRELRERMELDDFSGAIELAQRVLELDGEDAEAVRAFARSRQQLLGLYGAKLGNLRGVPRVRMAPGEVIWLDLDHRAGFVLAQVDGVSSYEEIIEVTGMDELMALRILAQLAQNGVIGA